MSSPLPKYTIRRSRILVTLLMLFIVGVHYLNSGTANHFSSYQQVHFPSLTTIHEMETSLSQIRHLTRTNASQENLPSPKLLALVENLKESTNKLSQITKDLATPYATKSLENLVNLIQIDSRGNESERGLSERLQKIDLAITAVLNDLSQYKTSLEQLRSTQHSQFMHWKLIMGALTLLFVATILTVRFVMIRELTSQIAKKKKVAAELEQQRVRSESAARLASIGEMAGGIAHEINNPIAIIKGYAEILTLHIKKGTLVPNEAGKLVANILKTTDRIAKIVSSLRKLSRHSELDVKESVPLSTVIGEAMNLSTEKTKSHGFNVEIHLEANPEIICNPVEFSQVIINLINNAFDATADLPERWMKIESHLSKNGESVEISLTDSGAGIPENLQFRIFQPYFTTKPLGKGTGLGLSISKSIIEGHGGTFEYDSHSKHTRFLLSLPIADAVSQGQDSQAA